MAPIALLGMAFCVAGVFLVNWKYHKSSHS
jgi:hypothetical protein